MTAISYDRVIGVQYSPISEDDLFLEEKHKKQHTLEEFAIDFFRPPPKSSISRRQGILTKDLWSHTRVPIKLPLLKTLQNDKGLIKAACSIFKNILKYSGEYSTNKTNQACAFTDNIFSPALKEPRLRDEVYMQIIKQLTNTKANNDISAWELMWLVTGTFPCTQHVRPQVDQFLDSAKRRWLAKDCLGRLKKVMTTGTRMYPPNLVEVETIRCKMTKILNTVYYPNDTEGFFEVDSSTRNSEFEAAITERLGIKPSHEFKLFCKIGETVVSMPGDMFFYDYMRHDHLAKEAIPPRQESDPNEIYRVVALVFMRKTWADMVPGEDPKADSVFHYHQEIPKYIRGWHKNTMEEAMRLAALICRVKIAGNKKFNGEPTIRRMPLLKDLLPKDMLGSMLDEEWKKDILATYHDNNDGDKSEDEAKAEILNMFYQWPTFGSAFVDIRQDCLPSLPEILLVALNKNGLHLMDPERKDILKTFPMEQILVCNGDQKHFEIALKEGAKKTKVLQFETELGYKFADLFSAYKNGTKRAAEL